jgi:hypothetical protein
MTKPNDDNAVDDGGGLTSDERSALAAWAQVAPSAEFAERVAAATSVPAAKPAVPSENTDHSDADNRGGRAVGLFASPAARRISMIVAVAAVAAFAMTIMRQPNVPPSADAITVSARTAVRVGTRGVAVAEPGAQLAWKQSSSGAADVTQNAGNVFYRVERGGAFVVHTPAGNVEVTGTCFRVEVMMKPNKNMIVSGAVGAAVAAAVVVTVYEGGVVIAHGQARQAVAAGDSTTILVDNSTNGGPLVASGSTAAGAANNGATVAPSVADNDPLPTTVPELQAKLKAQRDELAALNQQIAQLKTGGAAPAKVPDGYPHPSAETLKAWAAECHTKFDHPGLLMATPPALTKGNDTVGDGEVAAVNEAVRDVHAKWIALVRDAYIEVTGDTVGAKTLSPSAMMSEIEDKGAAGELDALRARIANERAGLAEPPPPGTKMTALEREYRAYASLGDDTEAAIAKRLGAARARAIRGQGWSSQAESSGCAP